MAESPLRILHLYKDYHPILGGIENHIKMLAETQAAAGHQVTVLVTNPGGQPPSEMINGVQVIRVPRLATVASTPITFGFPAALKSIRPEITHLHFPYPVGEISQYFWGKRPYVITYHSDVVRASQQGVLRLYRPLLGRILRHAARVMPTSENYISGSPSLQKVMERCTVIPLGIDPQPFLTATPSARRGPRPVLLFVGRHRYYKGVDDLIRTMPDLDADLWIAGSGPLTAEWQQLAAELALGEKVRFWGDVPEQNLPELYASADIFVLPANARAEAFGTVLLEAMAAGLPCVTTELGTGTSFVVRHGVTGVVTAPNNPDALGRVLLRLLADEPLCRQMGAAGRARLLREFTLERMAAGVETVYAECLA